MAVVAASEVLEGYKNQLNMGKKELKGKEMQGASDGDWTMNFGGGIFRGCADVRKMVGEGRAGGGNLGRHSDLELELLGFLSFQGKKWKNKREDENSEFIFQENKIGH